jgi:RND family efflux transporter MFP subunit
MKRPKLIISIATAVVVLAGTAVLIWRMTHRSTKPATEPAEHPVATVTTTPLRTGSVSQTVTAYGNVTAEPGSVAVLSAAVECRVVHLRVAGGQAIDGGTAVIEVEPSPDAKMQLLDARNALDGAKKDSANAHQRLDLKLTTTTEAQTADQAVRNAQAKLDDLTRRGAAEDRHTITADAAGVVAKVDVQEGQLVPAGAPLVEVVPAGQIEVRLGVEPAVAMLVRADQPVRLFPAYADSDPDEEPITARLRLVTRRVNPDSRLVDVFAKPGETDRLLLDSFVRGELTVQTVSGLVVPREALQADDDKMSIFVVEGQKAVRHTVKVALQDDKSAVITSPGLHDGDPVVVGGSLELDDGTTVKATAPTTAPAEDEK